MTPAVQPEAAANAGTDLQHAQSTEQAFMQEIQQTPKEAVATATASAATADPAQAVPAAKPGGTGIFNSDFLKKLVGTPAPEQEAPKQQEYKPFADTESGAEQQQAGAAVPPGDVADNYLFIETLKNGALATGLGWLSQTPSKRWLLPEEAEQRLAKVAQRMKVKWIEDMDGGTQYAMMNAFYYGPMVKEAYDMGQVNRKNAAIAAQVKPNGNSMQHAAAKVVPFHVNMGAAPTAKGERTRYEIHSDGTYSYSRKFPDRAATFLKIGSPECEKVNLGDTEAIKHIILKNGGWKKVAAKLGLTDEWMIQRGLNTNNPEIAD